MRLLGFKQLRPEKGISYTQRHIERKVKAKTFPEFWAQPATTTAAMAWRGPRWVGCAVGARRPGRADPGPPGFARYWAFEPKSQVSSRRACYRWCCAGCPQSAFLNFCLRALGGPDPPAAVSLRAQASLGAS
jgi:hypothetical protein